jgi:hypothetical protein
MRKGATSPNQAGALMHPKLAFVIAALAVMAGSPAFGQSLLSEADINAQGAGVAIITSALNPTIGIGLDQSPPSALLFEHLMVQTADVGHTFTIGPDDPDFASFAAYLTDAHVSYLSDSTTVGRGSWGEWWIPEARFFSSLPPGNNGTDLGGFEITSFNLLFNSLQFLSPGSNPNGDGVWTDINYSAVFSVYGMVIPEPASLTTVMFGTAALIARTKMLTRRRA